MELKYTKLLLRTEVYQRSELPRLNRRGSYVFTENVVFALLKMTMKAYLQMVFVLNEL